MTFGAARWGSSDDASARVFDAFLDAGGNFVDTADVCAGVRSEELPGRLVAKRGVRDRGALATRFGFYGGGADLRDPNPNAGGNGRKQV